MRPTSNAVPRDAAALSVDTICGWNLTFPPFGTNRSASSSWRRPTRRWNSLSRPGWSSSNERRPDRSCCCWRIGLSAASRPTRAYALSITRGRSVWERRCRRAFGRWKRRSSCSCRPTDRSRQRKRKPFSLRSIERMPWSDAGVRTRFRRSFRYGISSAASRREFSSATRPNREFPATCGAGSGRRALGRL